MYSDEDERQPSGPKRGSKHCQRRMVNQAQVITREEQQLNQINGVTIGGGPDDYESNLGDDECTAR